jgi:hypothetical protein
MSKKDYVKLAAALANARPHSTKRNRRWTVDPMENAVWRDCCTLIADTLANDNPKFDRARFIAATEA